MSVESPKLRNFQVQFETPLDLSERSVPISHEELLFGRRSAEEGPEALWEVAVKIHRQRDQTGCAATDQKGLGENRNRRRNPHQFPGLLILSVQPHLLQLTHVLIQAGEREDVANAIVFVQIRKRHEGTRLRGFSQTVLQTLPVLPPTQ